MLIENFNIKHELKKIFDYICNFFFFRGLRLNIISAHQQLYVAIDLIRPVIIIHVREVSTTVHNSCPQGGRYK